MDTYVRLKNCLKHPKGTFFEGVKVSPSTIKDSNRYLHMAKNCKLVEHTEGNKTEIEWV